MKEIILNTITQLDKERDAMQYEHRYYYLKSGWIQRTVQINILNQVLMEAEASGITG